MIIKGEINFKYATSDDAEVVYEALEVDNENYLKSRLDQNLITYNIHSDKLGTFLATIDDLIASEIVVEKIIDKTKQWKLLYK